MTDRIDLDDVDAGEEPADAPNYGDWLWRGEGDPDAEPGPAEAADATDAGPDAPAPHVPRANRDRPVGIPKEGGGAGGAAAGDRERRSTRTAPAGGGPHGGGVDDMTMALTYGAVRRLADPAAVMADAARWADWVGIVGDVEAHVITAFQREHAIDADFFNGSGTGPGERLADVDEHSMFYAERMVVVGREGADEPVAERAGWEFVPLSEAASEAGWELTGDGPG